MRASLVPVSAIAAAVATAVAIPSLCLSQGAAPTIPVRPLGATVVASAPMFSRVTTVRQLSDGRVLVNDLTLRQIVQLDANLANPVVIMDSAAGKANSYGTTTGGLIPFTADSSLFAERTSKSFVVLDPGGKIVRVMPIPGVSSYLYVTSPGLYGFPTVSPRFGVVFQNPARSAIPSMPPPGSAEVKIVTGDSLAVMGMHLDTRALDTIIKFATGRGTTQYLSATGVRSESAVSQANALMFAVSDAWAVTSDGSIAILRARDYRIDWLNVDGTRTASPRLPFNWQQNADADKIRIADSISMQFRKADSATLKRWIDDSVKAATTGPAPQTDAQASIAATLAQLNASAAAAGATIDPSMLKELDAIANPHKNRPTARPPMRPTDIPDYMPAVATGSDVIRGDEDNRLWIKPKQVGTVAGATPQLAVPAGTIYDIVDRKGALIDRVQIPAGKTLVGFGPGGIVYLTSRDAGKIVLERARFK